MKGNIFLYYLFLFKSKIVKCRGNLRYMCVYIGWLFYVFVISLVFVEF